MEQFSLDEYLKSPKRKVVTRGGSPVKILCTNYNTDQPIIAEIEGTNCSESFNKDGKWLHFEDSEKDLFFATEKHERWINLYKDGDIVYASMDTFNTKKEAEVASCSTCVATIKIEWEE